MTDRLKNAGSGPQVLARQRRLRSKILKVVAISLLIIPLALLISGIVFPVWAYILVLIAARLCFLQCGEFERAAARADRGGKAEQDVAALLQELPAGWYCEAGLFFKGLGDIDLFVTTPTGKSIVIDVKSHKGKVAADPDGRRLIRIIDGAPAEFEKDIVNGVRNQALRICRERSLTRVIPVLVFTRAEIEIEENQLDGVFIVKDKQLVNFLISLENDHPQNQPQSRPRHRKRSAA